MAYLIPLTLGSNSFSMTKRTSKSTSKSNSLSTRINGDIDIICRFPSAPPCQVKRRACPLQRPTGQPQQQTKQLAKTEQGAKLCRPPPHTNMEWRVALGEIKREYAHRRLRQCSARCHDILEHGDKLDNAHPIHLVYLRFYAATALEMQARSLPPSSPYRLSFLKQAHAHFSIASTLASQAFKEVSRSSLRINTFLPLHSTSSSDSSLSTASTEMSSPAPSLGSVDETETETETYKLPKKKKVSFSDDLILEPVIRPDSPTLGFDEWLGRRSSEPIYPESILKPVRHSIVPYTDDVLSMSDLSDEEDMDPFYQIRSIHRFCSILSSIRRQMATLMTSLEIEIAAWPTARTSPKQTDLEIKSRIERLRACRWERPRFDPQRYKTLCENALAELME